MTLQPDGYELIDTEYGLVLVWCDEIIQETEGRYDDQFEILIYLPVAQPWFSTISTST
jgi:hypothetical protein